MMFCDSTRCGQTCSKYHKDCGNRSAIFRHVEEFHPQDSRAACAGGGAAVSRHHQSNTSCRESTFTISNEDFPPLNSQVPKTTSPSQPVMRARTESRVEAAARAKQNYETEGSRRERLRVQGQRAERNLSEAERLELQEVRKGHHHSLPSCWPPRCK